MAGGTRPDAGPPINGWTLFSNCDGTDTPQFNIYWDCTEAWAAYNPLPELGVANVSASGDCWTYDITFDVVNIGCVDHLGDVPVAIKIYAGSDRVAVNHFVGDLDRALRDAKLGYQFALVVPRRYELRGVLLTDLPAGADPALEAAVTRSALDLIRLVAPTTDDRRLTTALNGSTGFVYLISRLGVTGARDSAPPDLDAHVRRAYREGLLQSERDARAEEPPLALVLPVGVADEDAVPGRGEEHDEDEV